MKVVCLCIRISGLYFLQDSHTPEDDLLSKKASGRVATKVSFTALVILKGYALAAVTPTVSVVPATLLEIYCAKTSCCVLFKRNPCLVLRHSTSSIV